MRVSKIEWDAIWEELGEDWYLEGDWDEFAFEESQVVNLDPVLCFVWQGMGEPKPTRLIFGQEATLKSVVTRWRKSQKRANMPIQLCSGLLFDPWAPAEPVPTWEEVSFALSNLCRYGGHVGRFYSVGEHSLWVMVRLISFGPTGYRDVEASSLARLLTMRSSRFYEILRGLPADRALVALEGLVHDGPEGAGLVDVPGPIKLRPEMAPYREAEKRLASFLCAGWGLPDPKDWHEEVQASDRSIMGAENALRPWNDGEDKIPWSWLDLVGSHVLDDGSTTKQREYVRLALARSWHVLREAAGLGACP